MPNEKPTQEIEQLAVIRGLLERQIAKTDATDAKVDAARAEATARGAEQSAWNKRVEADVNFVRREVERLNKRMADAESDIRELRDQDATTERVVSETSLETEAAIGGAIAHVKNLEAALGDIKRSDETQTRVGAAICRELGLDYDAIADGRDSAPESDEGPSADEGMAADGEPQHRRKPAKAPSTKLTTLASQNKKSLGATIAAVILVAAQIALELLKQH